MDFYNMNKTTGDFNINIKQNMLIIDNAISLLVELLNQKNALYENKEENRKHLCELFGADIFEVFKGLSKDELCKTYIGIDRSTIKKSYDGTVQGKSNKLADIFCQNKLLSDDEYNKFSNGAISIKIIDNQKKKELDSSIKKYFEETEQLMLNRKTGNQISKKKIYSKNQEINSTIQKYIKEYVKEYIKEGGKSAFSLEKGKYNYRLRSPEEDKEYLNDNWLILFLQWISQTVIKKRNSNKSIVNELEKFKRNDFERLNMKELEEAVGKLHELYINVYSLYQVRKWH